MTSGKSINDLGRVDYHCTVSPCYQTNMLVLSEKQVQTLIDIDELIAVLERTHLQYSTGQAVMPVRLVVPLPQIDGRITSMPGYLNEDKALGMKVVTYFQGNPRSGLPAILATVLLFSAETGKLLAAMDGAYTTAIRTACASAMATRNLANPDSRVLAILGAGVQARAHVEALCRVRKFARVKIYSPSGASGARLKEQLEEKVGVTIDLANSSKNAIEDADVIVTATTAKTPILSAAWLKPGVHINAVGSHRPDARELDGATLAGANLVVDSRTAIMAECGDILLALEEGSLPENLTPAEIGEVLAGIRPGRTRADELTVYKSVGIAVQDVATAHLVYHKAREQKIGTIVEI